MTQTNLSSYRRKTNRCESIKVEFGTADASEHRRRSWRCDLKVGHHGPHESRSGHRRWEDVERLTLFDPA